MYSNQGLLGYISLLQVYDLSVKPRTIFYCSCNSDIYFKVFLANYLNGFPMLNI